MTPAYPKYRSISLEDTPMLRIRRVWRAYRHKPIRHAFQNSPSSLAPMLRIRRAWRAYRHKPIRRPTCASIRKADTTRISTLAILARAYAAHTARVARLSA